MKLSLQELRSIVEQGVSDALTEAKKKKKSADDPHPTATIAALSGSVIDPVLDFAEPQGLQNRLRKQGASGMGPWTSEQLLRAYVKRVAEGVISGKKGG